MAMAIAVAMTKAMAMAMVMAMPMSAVSKRGASKGGVSETEVGHETGPQCAISDDTPAGVQKLFFADHLAEFRASEPSEKGRIRPKTENPRPPPLY